MYPITHTDAVNRIALTTTLVKQKGVNLVKKDAALAMSEDALLCAEVSSDDRMALPPDPPPPPEPRPPNPPILEELDWRETRRRRKATVARAFSFSWTQQQWNKRGVALCDHIHIYDDISRALSLSVVIEVRAAHPCAKALSYSSQTAFAQPSTVAASRASSRVYRPIHMTINTHKHATDTMIKTLSARFPFVPSFSSEIAAARSVTLPPAVSMFCSSSKYAEEKCPGQKVRSTSLLASN